MTKSISLGSVVQYKSGGYWKPCGIVVAIEKAIAMNSAVISGEKYKVKWINDPESSEMSVSGWLSERELSVLPIICQVRGFDWVAEVENNPEILEYGKTRDEAILNLLDSRPEIIYSYRKQENKDAD